MYIPTILTKRQSSTNTAAIAAITPTKDQRTTLYIIFAYIAFILIVWNIPYLKHILYPFKLVTVAFHEFSHAFAGVLTGAKIVSIKIDPNEGGLTVMRGGFWWFTMPAGYLGSSFIGALMILAGFNITASKVVSVIIILCLLATLFWANNWLTRIITFLFIAIIIALWVLFQAKGLKYFVLFMGVMSCFYSLWDIVEDLVTRKVHQSDATLFAEQTGFPSQCCGVIWLFISFLFFASGIMLGIILFK
ncbi:hypothetical protein BB559_003835 [Furculomyces boomerangus]|uniref:Peptidase M50B-like-domain-containing protein n=2 Tax=Harpellales TaxID=61421 RepID=A0A2T9YIG6_9FUNG|nr:hypothetical protein BB559_003835 [Furculomyces boomerangus]PVZ98802.1 hypothetical protein BB558_005193 [Smittium angustum]